MMTRKDKIAFGIYVFGSLLLISFGILYLSCSTIMPYHQEAIQLKWDDLSSGLQVLLQAFIKALAGGFLVTGISIMILTLIPFRKGASWSKWAIPLIAVIWNAFLLYVTVTVAIKTHAQTPWPFSVFGIMLATIGYTLSPTAGTKRETEIF